MIIDKPKKCGGCDHLMSCCDGSRWFCDRFGYEANPMDEACHWYENGPDRRRYE